MLRCLARACVLKYRSSIRVVLHAEKDKSYADQLSPEKREAVNAVVWATGEGDDEDTFSARVQGVIRDFERVLGPYLGR